MAVTGHAEIIFPSWSSDSPRVQAVYWTAGEGFVHWPLLSLHEPPSVKLHFDILDDDEGENTAWLQASIKHYDSNWQPDMLPTSRYLDGFNIFDIGYGTPSVGALSTLYTHFDVDFNQLSIQPLLSGNYMLEVFPSENPDSVVLAVAFLVIENSVSINAEISPVTDIDYKLEHQQLDIDIDIEHLNSLVTPQYIYVITGQNFTPGMWRYQGMPSVIKGNRLSFSHIPTLIYEAGNEFRRMEIIDNTVPMMNVAEIKWIDPFYHQFLLTDYPRNNGEYNDDFSTHGSFVIRERNTEFPETEADYAVVHFSLDGSDITPGSKIYLEGNFVPHELTDLNLMEYDAANNLYYKSLFLKQGAYSYRYLYPDGETMLDIEGNFFPTVNLYPVAVYYRIPGENYDRLGGATVFSSRL